MILNARDGWSRRGKDDRGSVNNVYDDAAWQEVPESAVGAQSTACGSVRSSYQTPTARLVTSNRAFKVKQGSADLRRFYRPNASRLGDRVIVAPRCTVADNVSETD